MSSYVPTKVVKDTNSPPWITLPHLDPTKATGPDGIPARVLRECSYTIAPRPSLCSLFNHSLHTGTVPSEWKSADVSPIHKKDKKELAINV